MARGNRPIEVRLDDATKERWTSAAKDAGLSLSTFIRECVDERLGLEGEPGKKPKRPPSNPSNRGVKAGPKGDLDRRDVQTFFKS